MMVKVLIHGYATGVFSSRGVARRLEEDVAFRVLAAGNFPIHRTICEFRRRHPADFKRLFVGVVRLAAETGVANFGKLSIDGTKVQANASKRKAMSYGRMLEEGRLQAEVDALVERARAVDEAEDARFGEGFRGDELPDELSRRQDRLAAIRAAKSRLEARQREADDAGYCNEADLARLEALGVDGYVALGREGRREVAADADRHPAKAAMAEKLATEPGRAQYAERKRRAEAPIGWIKEALGFPPVQPARAGQGAGRVGPGLPGVERQADARASGGLIAGDDVSVTGIRRRHGAPWEPLRARLTTIRLQHGPFAQHPAQPCPCDNIPTPSRQGETFYSASS